LSDEPTSDKSLELAYTAAQDRLSEQVATLARLRSRANNLLSTAALFVSFSTGVGLINSNQTNGVVFRVAAIALLLVVVALGLNVLKISWIVKGWAIRDFASEIVSMADKGNSEAAIRRHIIGEMIKLAEDNERELEPKRRAFRRAVVLLLFEVLVLLVAVALR
jgi:hypothetical protein